VLNLFLLATRMSYPFFPCSVCSAYVQLRWRELEKHSMPVVSQIDVVGSRKPIVMVTSELESDDYVNNCRGQGRKYAERCTDKGFQIVVGKWNHPDDHFNFDGLFQGVCCFCAARMDLSLTIFKDIACYHCKQRDFLFREFALLRVVRKATTPGQSPSWETHGWGALSDTLVDYILALALNNRVGDGGRIDRMLTDC
jgi:hypothetical protein